MEPLDATPNQTPKIANIEQSALNLAAARLRHIAGTAWWTH